MGELTKEKREGEAAAARWALPLLLELLPAVVSVVQVGCGSGAWMAAAEAEGIGEVAGIDGPWVDTTDFAADRSALVTCDIREPFDIGRTFDLVLCIEVAEHLPARRADSFVADLCRLGPVVVFSAAVPGQGGYGHVNEQWPAYWFTPFESAGYALLDPLRDRMWDDPVGPAYLAQNLLVAVRRSALDRYPGLAAIDTGRPPRSVVHPGTVPGRALTAEEASRKLGVRDAVETLASVVRQRTMEAVRRVRHADS
jgi:SAM-dependent methyltransferase